MFVGRETEIKYIDYFYHQTGNKMLVLYGQKGVGKSALLQKISDFYPSNIYTAVSVSAKQQKSIWKSVLKSNQDTNTDYQSLLQGMIDPFITKKQVIILDEFHLLVKNDASFVQELSVFLQRVSTQNPVLIILASSAVAWVEQDMIKELGKTATSVSGLLKVKKLSFETICSLYPQKSKKELLKYYALLGGTPGLWKLAPLDVPFETFLADSFLSGNCMLSNVAQNMLGESLRETAVYNTIMLALAKELNKLNDIHALTEFSRAKISVYLKNLSTLGFVERIFSFDQGNQKEAQKGIYRICEPLLYFYYRFIFSRLGEVKDKGEQAYYRDVIAPDLERIYHAGYVSVCKEYLLTKMVSVGEWFGKSGKIDIVCKDAKNQYYVCKCLFDRACTEEDIAELKSLAKHAGIKTCQFIVFQEVGQVPVWQGKEKVLCISVLKDE